MGRTNTAETNDGDQLVADLDDPMIDEMTNAAVDDFIELDELQSYGINAADISKLKLAGITSMKGVSMAMTKDLVKIKGLSEAKIEKIKEAASKGVGLHFISAKELSSVRERIFKLTTGSKELDALIGGGPESRSITEIFGEFRTGKTQCCHTLCVTAQLPLELGGAAGKALYIDTEGTFRPDRLRPIAERFDMDPDIVLENVTYIRVHNSEQQNDIILQAAALMADDRTYRLLIIDSVMALFRCDYSGRGELAERQQRLNQHLARLCRLAEEFNLAVVITNQMTADPGGMTFAADPKKPIGGNIIAHASATRLYFRKGRGESRICKLYDSPDMPEAECTFAIANGGIVDAAD
eukprot:Clim_evm17s229 gene=Clim_evmTU17s229